MEPARAPLIKRFPLEFREPGADGSAAPPDPSRADPDPGRDSALEHEPAEVPRVHAEERGDGIAVEELIVVADVATGATVRRLCTAHGLMDHLAEDRAEGCLLADECVHATPSSSAPSATRICS